MFTSIATLLLSVTGVTATIFYAGVAESSGEFGVYSANAVNGTGLPGRFGVDYSFISESAIDVYVDQNKVWLFLDVMCIIANITRSIRSE